MTTNKWLEIRSVILADIIIQQNGQKERLALRLLLAYIEIERM